MMKRRVLIIANPGDEQDKKHFCKGVAKDIDEYMRFFCSCKGGAWYEDEITVCDREGYDTVKNCVQYLDKMDYSMIIFSGHGYANEFKETVLELSPYGDECKAKELVAARRTVILDCCRKVWRPSRLQKRAATDALFESAESVSVARARRMYEEEIEKSDVSPVVLYSCNIDECSQDDSSRGGVYSWHLLNEAVRWDGVEPLDVVQAHEKAAENMDQDRLQQHPQICKCKWMYAHYYPFALGVW